MTKAEIVSISFLLMVLAGLLLQNGLLFLTSLAAYVVSYLYRMYAV